MDEVSAAVAALESKRRLTQGIVVVHVAVYAAALLLFAFGKWTPAAVLGGANLLFYFLGVRRFIRTYAQAATEANLRHGLCASLEDVDYRPKGGMTQAELEEWAMLPIQGKGTGLLCRHFLSGREGELRFTCAEVTFHYGTAGAKGREEQRFLSGTVVTARSPSDAPMGDWLLLREDLLEPGAREEFLRAGGYQGARGAPEGFLLFAHREGEQLPEPLAQRISGLYAESKRLAALRLAGNGAAAYLDLRFYTGSGYPTARPDAARLRGNTLPERDGLWDLFRFWFAAGKE